MKITFKEFNRFLVERDYREFEIRHLFCAIRSMDQESIGWIVRWFCKGTYPDVVIEGVTARELVENGHYRPINALIILDWLKHEPQKAKYYMTKLHSTISPGDQIGEEVQWILRAEGIEPENEACSFSAIRFDEEEDESVYHGV